MSQWKVGKFLGRTIKYAEWEDGTWAVELYSEPLNRRVTIRKNSDGEVGINWSALGEVPAEAAREYSKLIEDAVTYTMRVKAGTLKIGKAVTL